MRVSFSVTLDNSPKPLSDASFSVFKPLSRSSIITTDDKALKMELPMDSPWLLQSKTLEKIVLGYGGLYEEYPPTFTIYINQVPENSDPHAAEVEYIRTLEDQKRLEVGSDYFPISKASILANTDPIQFKFNFAIDDPQTGLKRQDYRNWKGYVIYKNGIVYCLIGEAYDMLKFEDQFDALAALVKIK
jgi:hypothetical protein